MKKEIIISITALEIRVAVLEDGDLVDCPAVEEVDRGERVADGIGALEPARLHDLAAIHQQDRYETASDHYASRNVSSSFMPASCDFSGR